MGFNNRSFAVQVNNDGVLTNNGAPEAPIADFPVICIVCGRVFRPACYSILVAGAWQGELCRVCHKLEQAARIARALERIEALKNTIETLQLIAAGDSSVSIIRPE